MPPNRTAASPGAVVVDRTDRVVLRVTGRDPVRMLQGLVTNDLAGAPADATVYAAFLTPKGRMVADARLRRAEGAVLLETAAAAEPALREHLRKYVPPLFARVEDGSGPAVLGVYGPRAAAVVEEAEAGAVMLPPIDVPASAGVDLLVEDRELDRVRAALLAAGARAADLAAVEVLRVEAGRPRWGAELDETVIPLEAGLLERAISTTKGCYTGQEVIVRILHRGHVNRHLRGILLGDAPPPEARTAITAADGDRAVGRITSAIRSPALGMTIGLGYVRREVEPGDTVHVEGRPATIAALPFAPAPAGSPPDPSPATGGPGTAERTRPAGEKAP